MVVVTRIAGTTDDCCVSRGRAINKKRKKTDTPRPLDRSVPAARPRPSRHLADQRQQRLAVVVPRLELRQVVRPEAQGRPVDAVALVRGRRAVVEDVPEVPRARAAPQLHAHHERQRGVGRAGDGGVVDGRGEAGPAGACFVCWFLLVCGLCVCVCVSESWLVCVAMPRWRGGRKKRRGGSEERATAAAAGHARPPATTHPRCTWPRCGRRASRSRRRRMCPCGFRDRAPSCAAARSSRTAAPCSESRAPARPCQRRRRAPWPPRRRAAAASTRPRCG